jgi:hypothetical protein
VYGAFGPTVLFAVAGALVIASAIWAAFVLRGPVGARSRSVPDATVIPVGT